MNHFRMISLIMAMVALGTPWAARAQEFTANFDADKPGPPAESAWRTTGFTWSVAGGKLTCGEPDKTFALPLAVPAGRRVEVRASIAADRAIGTQWKVAGLCVYADERNYWHLAMAESPADKAGKAQHGWELIECYRGAWLANFNGETALPALGQDVAGSWEYGKTYRMKLSLTGEGITGEVTDDAGKVVFRRGYGFAAGKPAVSAGRGGLDCAEMRVAFDDVAVRVADAVGEPASQAAAPKYPAYDRPAMCELSAKAGGFFRVERIDGVWWLIDPKGQAFYDVGTDHASYDAHWCEKLGYAPHARNMRKQFPNIDDWCRQTAERLKAWGFNCVAAGHSPELRHRGLVHTEFISFGARFSTFSDITPKVHWTGFPNVFHPLWENYCRKVAEQFCRRQAGDPWLLGYFLDNELEWYGKTYHRYGLVAEAWSKPPAHQAKAALVDLLRRRHGTIEALNAAWGTTFAGFDALAASDRMPDAAGPAADADRDAYLELIADRYFGAACRAIRAADPNHLILGCRFAGGVQDVVWRSAGRNLDIVSLNQYERLDLEAGTAERAKADLLRVQALCGRPMMLTEWSYPAMDSNLPCTQGAGMRVDTQAQRAEAFAIYQKLLFSLPFMVGSHYFMWVDEPALGISSSFPENTNYGLVKESGEPWPELTEMAAKVNPQAAAIHAGRTSEIAVAIDPLGRQAVLKNSGKLDATVLVEVYLDGVSCPVKVPVPAGKEVRWSVASAARLPQDAPVPVTWVVLRADPARTCTEVDRCDNEAAAVLAPAGAATDQAPATLVVGNPTGERLRGVVARAKLTGALAGGATASAVDGGAVPAQQLAWGDDGLELAVLVDDLRAFGQRTFVLRASADAKPIAAEVVKPPLEVACGAMKLLKSSPGGDLADDVVLDGVRLGQVQAMIHQNAGQDLWLSANRLVEIRRTAGPVETVLDFNVAYAPAEASQALTAVDDQGKAAAARGAGRAWNASYRLRIPAGGPAFQVQCLSVTNADEAAWQLVEYFVYLPSHIGGQVAGDKPGVGEVPNYYGLQSVWFDAAAQAGFGAVAPEPLKAHFWLDPGGRQHPDICRDVNLPMKHGQTFRDAKAPPIQVFGVRGKLQDRPWRLLAADLAARARVTVALRP